MKCSVVIILFLFSGLLTAHESLQTIKSHVLDRQTQTPLIRATIELKQGSLGLFSAYSQYLSLNKKIALEPRVAINFVLAPNQKLNLGYGLHHQMQALPIYFFESEVSPGHFERTNRSLDFSRSNHFITGYDLQLQQSWSIKTNLYYQQLQNIPVDKEASYFSVLNIGADFGFPDRANLVNQKTESNYGIL